MAKSATWRSAGTQQHRSTCLPGCRSTLKGSMSAAPARFAALPFQWVAELPPSFAGWAAAASCLHRGRTKGQAGQALQCCSAVRFDCRCAQNPTNQGSQTEQRRQPLFTTKPQATALPPRCSKLSPCKHRPASAWLDGCAACMPHLKAHAAAAAARLARPPAAAAPAGARCPPPSAECWGTAPAALAGRAPGMTCGMAGMAGHAWVFERHTLNRTGQQRMLLQPALQPPRHAAGTAGNCGRLPTCTAPTGAAAAAHLWRR